MWRATWKSLLARKVRLALTVLAIVLGVGFVSGTYVLTDTLDADDHLFAGLDAPPNYARADALWHHFKRVLPALREPDARATRWMGRRPGLPDSLPVIGPSRRMANVWYGFGHGHMGLTWGPTTGRLLGEIVSGAKPNIDLSAFRVDRF